MSNTQAYFGQKRGFPLLSKENISEMFPTFSVSGAMINLASHSYLPSEYPENDELACSLKDKLLSVGGTRIIMPRTDEDLEKTVSRGQFWMGSSAMMQKGLPSQCHMNSARLYMANKDKIRICTGYALSDDGIWRMHSWGIWTKPRSNKIVETTVKRVLYYGFVMTPEECEEFAEWY